MQINKDTAVRYLQQIENYTTETKTLNEKIVFNLEKEVLRLENEKNKLEEEMLKIRKENQSKK
jgi:hypothetical protein